MEWNPNTLWNEFELSCELNIQLKNGLNLKLKNELRFNLKLNWAM
jgi:hypothetical protein